jgi:hypothetical protein
MRDRPGDQVRSATITNPMLNEGETMSSQSGLIAVVAGAALVAAGTACQRGIEVRTMAAPQVRFAELHTFQMLPGPARRDGRPTTGADDPMISNSIANRAIRERIVKTLEERGYVLDEHNPDFAVAFYATAREKMDVTGWDYGYPFYPGWPRYPERRPIMTTYTEGSVVVDVVKASTHQLLWRGEGKAKLSDDPAENVQQLAKAARVIVDRFPSATPRVVATRP